MKRPFLFSLLLCFLLLGTSCSKDDDTPMPVGEVETEYEPVAVPFQELYDQGIDRYLGVFTPTSSVPSGAGITEYFFEIPNGPICYTGNEFSMFTRDGSSNNLLIFLQGGGFCSPFSCEAVEEGIPFIPFGMLSSDDQDNVASTYNVGYVPYCDGSAMIGDNEVDSDNDGNGDRFFRGAQNLSASLDVIFEKYPSPDKIVLAGNSAGGFAVHHALPLVRKLYPDVAIDLINDSGTGIINSDGWQMNLDYWNAGAFYPESCTSCIGADGNVTDYHKYQLEQDPNLRMAYISSKQDDTFAQITQGGGPAFEAQLLEAVNEISAEYPGRFGALIANGDGHTFVIRDFTLQVSNTNIRSWVNAMLSEDRDWNSVIE